MAFFEPTISALNDANVRYVVVGGVAVVLHGYARLTADLDLAVDLAPEEAKRAVDALVDLGFVPTAPVDPASFADPAARRRWMDEKHMRVFALSRPDNPLHEVDLFVENPIDFEELWARSEMVEVSRTVVRIASIEDLIEMKRAVGRPQDLEDVEALEAIREERDGG